MSRRKARESALQMLFQLDVGQNDWQAAENTLAEAEIHESNQEFARQVVRGTLENLEFVDKIINKYSLEWPVDRLANVDKTILRLAIFELAYMETSYKIVINESVELAKIFGGDESGSFINAILDSVYNKEIISSKQPETTEE